MDGSQDWFSGSLVDSHTHTRLLCVGEREKTVSLSLSHTNTKTGARVGAGAEATPTLINSLTLATASASGTQASLDRDGEDTDAGRTSVARKASRSTRGRSDVLRCSREALTDGPAVAASDQLDKGGKSSLLRTDWKEESGKRSLTR